MTDVGVNLDAEFEDFDDISHPLSGLPSSPAELPHNQTLKVASCFMSVFSCSFVCHV